MTQEQKSQDLQIVCFWELREKKGDLLHIRT